MWFTNVVWASLTHPDLPPAQEESKEGKSGHWEQYLIPTAESCVLEAIPVLQVGVLLANELHCSGYSDVLLQLPWEKKSKNKTGNNVKKLSKACV